MSFPSVPNNLSALVRSKHDEASSSGSLIFIPYTSQFVQENGITWRIAYCPSLAAKPLPLSPKPVDPSKPTPPPFNPFLPPAKELYLTAVGPDHYLLLNKFPAIPEHIILATTAFYSQDDLLRPVDLGAAWAALNAFSESDEKKRRIFGFFNSGEHSGASQAHRHVQFLPLPNEPESEENWKLFADDVKFTGEGEVQTHPGLTVEHFILPLSRGATLAQLHAAYLKLYKLCLEVTNPSEALSAPTPENFNASQPTRSRCSYNMSLTVDYILLFPRTAECPVGMESRDISINAATLCGMIIVKYEEDLKAVKREGVGRVLEGVGVKRSGGKNPDRGSRM